MSKYHSDQPVSKKANDEYNRSIFVDDFINILSDFEEKENYVIGLYAKWGLGKTSTVNMILENLEAESNFYGVYLSAWALGGEYEDVLWDILDQSSRKISGKSARTKRSRLGSFLSKTSNAEVPFELETSLDLNGGGQKETKISSGKIISTVSYVGRLLSSSDNIEKARKRVEEIIGDKKVIVFIDDLDRLEGRQIIDILRSINTIANYGGITYILPFDKSYVCSAIEEVIPKKSNGHEFLEKLIQIPINLPMLTQRKLDKIMLVKLDRLFKEFKIVLTEGEVNRFQRVYYYNANKYITSPRDINKILNVLRFKLPIITGEINVIDTIVIELIRVFDEVLYEKIRTNRELLVKHSNSDKYFMDRDNKKRKTDFDNIFENISDEKNQLLQSLFPIIYDIQNNQYSVNIEELRRHQRIASENYFDIYFASLDEDEGISHKKIIEILLETNQVELRKDVFNLLNRSNFDIALSIIVDNKDSIRNRQELCKILLDLVGSFSDRNNSIGFRFSLLETLIFQIDNILESSNNKLEDYIALLNHSIQRNQFETFILLIENFFIQSKNDNKRQKIHLDEEEVLIYKEHVLKIILDLSRENKIPLDAIDKSSHIYRYWKEIGKQEDISEYIKRNLKTADQALDFIAQFLSKSTAIGSNDYHRLDLEQSIFDFVSGFVEIDFLYNLIIANDKYKQLINIEKDQVISFEDKYDLQGNIDHVSRVGNEHTDAFRTTLAGQFIYLYEQSTDIFNKGKIQN